MAYLASDEINSVESDVAPAEESPDKPQERGAVAAPTPEHRVDPPVLSIPTMEKQAAPVVPVKASPIRTKPRPVLRRVSEDNRPRCASRREAEENSKPVARLAPDRRALQRLEQMGRGTERQQSRAASQGGARGAAPAAGGAEAQNWRGAVLVQLARHKQYPSAARDRNVTGTSIVSFTLSASGAVLGVSLAGGSGSSVLDQATLAIVHSAAPFPPAPPGARLSFTTAVNYHLR